jgi:hypothetical protein
MGSSAVDNVPRLGGHRRVAEVARQPALGPGLAEVVGGNVTEVELLVVEGLLRGILLILISVGTFSDKFLMSEFL